MGEEKKMEIKKIAGYGGDFDCYYFASVVMGAKEMVFVEMHQEHHGACAFRPHDWGYIIPGKKTEKEIWRYLKDPDSEYLAVWKNKHCCGCEECCPQQKKEEEFFLEIEKEVLAYRKNINKIEDAICGTYGKKASFEELVKILKENKDFDLENLHPLTVEELRMRLRRRE